MKKLYLILIFISVVSAIVNAQSYITIRTPKNVSVEAILYSESPYLDAIEAEAAQWIIDHNLTGQVTRIGPASTTYNCHSFAWNKSDGGGTVWVRQNDQNSNPNVASYWVGNYYTYSSTSQTEGTKVFLQQGDHSMIASTTNPGLYESKWGSWPLYRHTLTGHPYNMTNPQYFKLNISGSNFLCYPGSSNYSTLDITGGTYIWTGDNISMSGSSSSSTGTVAGNGPANVKVGITSTYSNTTIHGAYSVWIGPPTIQNKKADGSNYSTGMQLCPGNHALNVTPFGGNANNATWTVPSGITYMVGTNELDFVFPTTASSVSITCRSSNSCGTGSNSAFYLTKKTYGCPYSLSINLYPNPASDNITVDLTSNEIVFIPDNSLQTTEVSSMKAIESSNYTISIFNSQSSLVSQTTKAGKTFTIPLVNLKDGTYILEIRDENNNTNRKQFIIKHD